MASLRSVIAQRFLEPNSADCTALTCISSKTILTVRQVGACVALLSCRIKQRLHGARCHPILGCHVVAITAVDGLDLALLEFSCAFAGVLFCPLNPDEPLLRSEHYNSICCPAFTVSSVRDLLDCDELLPSLDNACIRNSFSPFLEVRSDGVSKYLYMMFTSGSTGLAKGVVVEERQLQSYLDGIGKTFFADSSMSEAVDPQEKKVLCLSSPTFDPSLGDIFAAFYHGFPLVVASRFDRLVNPTDILLNASPSFVISTPAIWRNIDVKKFAEYQCRQHIRGRKRMNVALGGERMSLELAASWCSDVHLWNIYGVTECVVYQSLHRIHPGFDCDDLSCIGQPLPGVKFVVEPNDSGESELVIEGTQISAGYLLPDDDGSIKFFAFRGRYSTGDLVRLSHTRELCSSDESLLQQWSLIGRKDTQIKLSGQRVNMEEIEQFLCRLPFVSACCAVPLGSSVGILFNAACEVHWPEEENICRFSEWLLRQVAVDVLPVAAAVSSIVCCVNPLPLSHSGKIDRTACAHLLEHHREAKRGTVESCEPEAPFSPRSEYFFGLLEAAVDVLFKVPISKDTNFFALGGDSLTALRMCRMVYVAYSKSDGAIDEFGELPDAFAPMHIWRHSTIGSYAKFLAAASSKDDTFIPDVPRAGRRIETSLPAEVGSRAHQLVELLHHCVGCGYAPGVATLLKTLSVSPDGYACCGIRALTPLHLACSIGRSDLVELLVSHGARLLVVSPENVTPGHLAAASSVSCLRVLVSNGFPIAVRDSKMQSLLHFAARAGNVASLKYLLQEVGCPLFFGVRDRWQRTPMHWAIINNHPSIVLFLLAFYSAANTSGDEHPSDPSASDPTAKLRIIRGKGQPRKRGWSYDRLARRHTNLKYETPLELAVRLHGNGSEIVALLKTVGEDIWK